MSQTSVLSYSLSVLEYTKTVVVRFMIFISGTMVNVPFAVSVNGVNVLYTSLSGSNFFQNIEVQFPLGVDYGLGSQLALALNFDSSYLATYQSSESFQWAIGQFALSYSNAPVGFIYNSYQGGYSAISASASYFTSLLSIYYSSGFAGYSALEQPIWATYVRLGDFQSGLDIISMNNIVLSFSSSSTTTLSNSFSGLEIFTSNAYSSVFASSTQTSLYLVGSSFDYSMFTSTAASFRILNINSIASIGYFASTESVSTTLVALSTTQSIAVRFTLFVLGDTVNAPFIITANGATVLNSVISTSSYYQYVEVVFPYTYSASQAQFVLALSFGAASSSFQWAMSQFAVSYSNAPAGYIYNSVTGGYTSVVSSYFTALLQTYYSGSFIGYSLQQQPTWLSYVLERPIQPRSRSHCC